jgi:hypothetical protein
MYLALTAEGMITSHVRTEESAAQEILERRLACWGGDVGVVTASNVRSSTAHAAGGFAPAGTVAR